MIESIDQMNQIIRLGSIPKRIVSLVPSQTEFLYAIGLEKEIVGITKFCIYPEAWFRSKGRVGGTKNVNFDKVNALQPDLIIGNKEENSKEDIEKLKSICPVWMSDIYNLEDACEMMLKIGEMTNKTVQSIKIISKIQSDFNSLVNQTKTSKSVLYLIWKNPYIAVGKNTFIGDMIQRIGLRNFISEERYPEIHLSSLVDKPDLIYLSSEPFPFKEKHIKELQEMFPNSKIELVDGELFSWYGSRLQYSVEYFKSLHI